MLHTSVGCVFSEATIRQKNITKWHDTRNDLLHMSVGWFFSEATIRQKSITKWHDTRNDLLHMSVGCVFSEETRNICFIKIISKGHPHKVICMMLGLKCYLFLMGMIFFLIRKKMLYLRLRTCIHIGMGFKLK